MITGFNTDIEYGGVVYHVQTEDKGVETPLILSLVYNRGTILASKRTSYNDLLQTGLDEKILVERLQKQHKLICAAVRAGRLEDLKQMTAKDAALKREVKAANSTAPVFNPSPEADANRPAPPSLPVKIKTVAPPVKEEMNAPPRKIEVKENFAPAIPQPKEELIWDLPLEIIEEQSVIVGEGDIIETETILSADAVEVITESGSAARRKKAPLEIEFLHETTFKAGDRKTLSIRVFRGASQNFISEAQVMVKVLGSSFRPLIFHARTNEEGMATVHLQLPQFRSGRGAILVRAISDGEEAELRQIVRQS